jgi:hypothetical protein
VRDSAAELWTAFLGSGSPAAASAVARCVIRTTSVDIFAFDDVDEAFARDEGEGDLSLEYWRRGHWAFFSRELEALGRTPQPDMPAVCEHFEVVYPTDSDTFTRQACRADDRPSD